MQNEIKNCLMNLHKEEASEVSSPTQTSLESNQPVTKVISSNFEEVTAPPIGNIDDREHMSLNKKEIIASGGRYDGLAKKIGLKKDIPAIGLKISSKNLLIGAPIHSKIKVPRFFFLQLGFEAKLKGLNVIEILRKSKILVCKSLSRDMLGGQIALAEKMKLPSSLIMGKKESMENTIMVRDMNTRAQETVPIGNLAAYLKRLGI